MGETAVAVSVIVLTYNHVKYIRQALDSVLSQKTTFMYEVLVGDDASTDGTTEIVQEYARKHPKIIRAFIRERNIGATRNGYELVTQAIGRYLAGCEGDDYWTDSQKLQIQFDFLESHPDFSACTHDITVIDENGSPQKNQKLDWISRRRLYSINDFKGIFLSGHPNSLMRRNFFLDAGFDGTILYRAHRMICDRTITLIWASRGKIYRIEQNMGCYRNVLSTDSTNITAKIYANNPNRIQDDWKYTLALERYANEELGIFPDFDFHKQQLLVGAIAGWFAGHLPLKLSISIIQSMKNPLGILFGCPPIATKKIWQRIRRKCEERV